MYLSLYCKGSKRVTQGFTVRGSWKPNKDCNILTPLIWPSALCLSRSPGLLNRRRRGSAFCWVLVFFYHHLCPTSLIPNSVRGSKGPLRRAFSTTSYQQLLWTPTQSGALRAPSAWCGFPHHISSLAPTLTRQRPQGSPPPGFLYHILSATGLVPKLHRGSRVPLRPGVAFPNTSRL